MLQLDFTPNLTQFPVSSPMLTFSKKIHKPSSQLWPWLTLEIFISRISHGHIRRALSLQQIEKFLLLGDWYGQSSKTWQLVLVINGDFSSGFFCCCYCHFVLVLRPIYFSINVWEIELMVHGLLFVYHFTMFLHGWPTTFCCMFLFRWSQLLFSFHFSAFSKTHIIKYPPPKSVLHRTRLLSTDISQGWLRTLRWSVVPKTMDICLAICYLQRNQSLWSLKDE